jgi:antitoxin (DNA-binding transcriptional repressor) of toxin-antitoxin stability system
MTRMMTISNVKVQFSSFVNEIYHHGIRIIVEKAGIPVVGIVPVEDLRRLEQLDREWEEGTRAIERFSAAFADVPVEEAEAEIARIIAEIRAKKRGEQEQLVGTET